jgi:hypothetical protein
MSSYPDDISIRASWTMHGYHGAATLGAVRSTFGQMKPNTGLMRADPAEISEAVAVFARTVELAWRSGAFACFFVLVTSTPEVPNLDGKLALLTAFGAFCFVPRLEVPIIGLATFLMGSLIATDGAPSVTSGLSDDLSVDLTLAWIAVGLVVCAGVLRAVISRSDRGQTDRDIALLLLGWVAATQVLVFTQRAVSGSWGSFTGDAVVPAGPKLVVGEGAGFLIAGAISVMVCMLALTLLSAYRAHSGRSAHALQSHTVTGAVVSAVAAMTLGNTIGFEVGSRTVHYQWLGAVLGVFAGLAIWLGFYVLCRNEHLRTWGALRALVLVPLLVSVVLGVGVGIATLDLAGAVAPLFLLAVAIPLGWDTWRRTGWTRRKVDQGYAQAMEAREWLDEQQAIGTTSGRTAGRGPLSADELREALANVERVRIVHACVTGHDFEEFAAAGPAHWRSTNVPEVEWLRDAANAGRWQAFWKVGFLHDSAVEEMNQALRELQAVQRSDVSPTTRIKRTNA